MEIVVATRNRKKFEEIRRILDGLGVTLAGVEEFPGCPEAEETEETFRGNALKKARTVSEFTGRLALADDSGLEVYALGGAPGVRSARYAGEAATDHDNLHKLLKELGNTPPENRGAAFACVMALVGPDGTEETFQGRVEGSIGLSPKGESGFGYDPVFHPEGHERTFAQMSPGEKDSMSHRGRALQRLREYLKSRDKTLS
jgi:XTP/dITP diphosphohydrolase